MKATTITVTETDEEKTISILVDAAYTASFYSFLRSRKVSCSQPSGAIFKTLRVEVDGQGNKTFQEKVLVNEIVATGTLDDFSSWLEDWIPELL